jgi:hypothetical protein
VTGSTAVTGPTLAAGRYRLILTLHSREGEELGYNSYPFAAMGS